MLQSLQQIALEVRKSRNFAVEPADGLYQSSFLCRKLVLVGLCCLRSCGLLRELCLQCCSTALCQRQSTPIHRQRCTQLCRFVLKPGDLR